MDVCHGFRNLVLADIFHRLLSVNATWFAQFYCELLLQVGLSPVQETDQELLNIADTDKLQVSRKQGNQTGQWKT